MIFCNLYNNFNCITSWNRFIISQVIVSIDTGKLAVIGMLQVFMLKIVYKYNKENNTYWAFLIENLTCIKIGLIYYTFLVIFFLKYWMKMIESGLLCKVIVPNEFCDQPCLFRQQSPPTLHFLQNNYTGMNNYVKIAVL